ncbi:lantibiotic biosynthesis dehydratase-like protein [Chryseobacterium sp. 52]|uniref:lantibiotic dehydratase n=1 Tax=Chryseobacterium sp. 52 TaxID=2035213 RepID=UPI000C18B607|nr:lantibiotic dehydratase [Chryseobacterium sp. 52]PIF46307.1 lantibiotic biosynthesis dehydratase-like protein [Chryseobacterium sp. 52]
MSLTILPYLFTRFAGLPVESLNALRIPEIEDQWHQWQMSVEHDKNCNDDLCTELYTLIQQSSDDQERKLLLNLKRSVYNRRPNTETLLQKIPAETFHIFKKHWEEWLKAQASYEEFKESWDQNFHHHLSSHRQNIQQLTEEYAFRNGLLLSSKDLYEQLESFSNKAVTTLKKDTERIEFSVLRYLTRMAYKTSPFSTFTYLGLTEMVPDDQPLFPPVPEITGCKIRLNNKLLKRIKKLMEQHPDLQGLLFVNTNSSMTKSDNRFKFLMNCSNIEVFQEIQATPVNQYIKELIDGSEESISLSSLIQLLSSSIEADISELKHYVLKLIDSGFLELALECSEINPDWDIHLLTFLSQHKDSNKAVGQLYELVSNLHLAKSEFSTADLSKREVLLKDILKRFESTISDLENQAGILKLAKDEIQKILDQILERYRNGQGFEKLPYLPVDYRQEGFIYEDAYTDQINTVNESTVYELGQLLSDLTNRLAAFDIRGKEKSSVKDFFISRYHKDQSVSLVSFYHEYYRHRNRSEADAGQKQLNSWSDIFWKELRQESASDEIKIQKKNLAHLPLSSNSTPTGSAFLQFFDQQSKTGTKAVVNGLMQGMGKMSGRFLHLFDHEISDVHRKYNERLFPHHLLIELNDDSSFNANIHPPLLDHEVKMPASNTQMKKSQQIPLDRISVGYHSDDDRLCLMDTVLHKEIYAFDLCLETITNRSNLYQLMSLFNPCTYVSYFPIIQAIDHNYSKQFKDEVIQIFPRIVYEDRLVLRRKGWLIPVSIIPTQDKDESSSIYFLRFNQWLLKNTLPSSVFLYLQSSYIPEDPSSETTAGTRDDYKPQFIGFEQPLLFNLFTKLLNRAGSYIYLEEALPSVNHVQNRVTEHLIQWYNF